MHIKSEAPSQYILYIYNKAGKNGVLGSERMLLILDRLGWPFRFQVLFLLPCDFLGTVGQSGDRRISFGQDVPGKKKKKDIHIWVGSR